MEVDEHTISPELWQLAEIAFLLKLECRNLQKVTKSFLSRKDEVISRLMEIERLLLLVDKKNYFDRVNIVKLLQYVGGGIEGREENIKHLLADIAKLEM